MDKHHSKMIEMQAADMKIGKREPFISKSAEDYVNVTLEDLMDARQRVLEGTEVSQEGALTMFPPLPGGNAPDQYGWWGYKLPSSKKLDRIHLSEAEQAHFDSLLNPVEDNRFNVPKSARPWQETEPPQGYRGPRGNAMDI